MAKHLGGTTTLFIPRIPILVAEKKKFFLINSASYFICISRKLTWEIFYSWTRNLYFLHYLILLPIIEISCNEISSTNVQGCLPQYFSRGKKISASEGRSRSQQDDGLGVARPHDAGPDRLTSDQFLLSCSEQKTEFPAEKYKISYLILSLKWQKIS